MRPSPFELLTSALVAAVVLGVGLLTLPVRAAAPSWRMSATVAESCSCTVSCPCNFGGEPSRMPCEGNRLITIDTGYYDGTDLAGVSLLVTFNMRNWSKVYVSDKVSDAQMQAVEALMPVAFAGFHKGMLSFTRAPIRMEITEERVRFSGPESAVEMAVMRGAGGTPVKILNLPSPVFQDYTQYRSVSHTHKGGTHSWSHSGTNGFVSKWEAKGQ
jgi:hypothetical protein